VLGIVCLQLGYDSSVARRAFWIWVFLTALPQIVTPALWKDNWQWLLYALSISAMVDIARGRVSLARQVLIVLGLVSAWLLRWGAAVVLIGLILALARRTKASGRVILGIAIIVSVISSMAVGIQMASVMRYPSTSPGEGIMLAVNSFLSRAIELELEGTVRSQLWGRPLSVSNFWYVVPLRFIEPFVAPSNWLPTERTLLQACAFFVTKITLFATILVLIYTLFRDWRSPQQHTQKLSRYLALSGLPLIFSVGLYPAGSDRYILTGVLVALPLVSYTSYRFGQMTRFALLLATLIEFWAAILYLYVK